MKNANIKKLVQRRHLLIPGGAHTYSKGDDQFPSNAPKVMLSGRGAYVRGDDGVTYLDLCMGLRSAVLGHADPDVNRAVARQMKEGTNFGRPHISEFALAEQLLRVLPNADMVKFAKNGSTVTTAAIKLARAYTGRDYVAYCADQPFFSYDDWFISTTAVHSGVSQGIKNYSLPFHYNDIGTLEKLFSQYPGKIACIIMEAATTVEPKDNFLKKVQKLCKKHGAIFILDEMITGFRWHLGGAQSHFGIQPDLSTFGKGIANGYSLAVLAGRRDIMELGGIVQKKRPRVFLISTTHGAETTALAAGMETIRQLQKRKVIAHLWRMGSKLEVGLNKLIKRHGLTDQISIIGFAPNLSLAIPNLKLKTVLLQELIKEEILFQGYFAISFAHKEKEIQKILASFDRAFTGLAKKRLVGPAVKPVFREFN